MSGAGNTIAPPAAPRWNCDNLEQIVKWLEPGSNAMLAELTRADYARLWKDWHLPAMK